MVQGHVLHCLSSALWSSHGAPLWRAGVSTVRTQVSVPPPHGWLHSPSSLQSDSTQSTVAFRIVHKGYF